MAGSYSLIGEPLMDDLTSIEDFIKDNLTSLGSYVFIEQLLQSLMAKAAVDKYGSLFAAHKATGKNRVTLTRHYRLYPTLRYAYAQRQPSRPAQANPKGATDSE